jgi:hypothetical protein
MLSPCLFSVLHLSSSLLHFLLLYPTSLIFLFSFCFKRKISSK